METRLSPKFVHLHDLGLSLQDSGRPTPTRQTLVTRGRNFALNNGLRIFTVGKDAYVSSAQLERLHEELAA